MAKSSKEMDRKLPMLMKWMQDRNMRLMAHRNMGRVINDIAQIVITILISNVLIISIPQDL